MTWSNMPFEQLMPLMWQGTLETLYMTLVSTLIAYVLGLPLGILLITTERDSLTPAPAFNKCWARSLTCSVRFPSLY